MSMASWRFDPVVDADKTITAYHAGDGVWVEVDGILDDAQGARCGGDVAVLFGGVEGGG